MRILIFHQFFLAKDDAGGSRWNQFAKYWARRGHQITVIAGNLHYATGKRHAGCEGRLLTVQKESPNVTVIRCHVSRHYAGGGKVGRAWAMLTFAFWAVVAAMLHAPRPDVIVATSPPLMVSLAMWAASVMFRAPAVFEVRDLWPDSIIDLGLLKSRPLQWFFYKLEYIGYHRAQWINVLTPAFERWLLDRKGIPPSRISMIPNGADLDLLSPGPRENAVREELGLKDKFVVSYFGAHGRANRVGQLLDVAALVKTELPDVRFMLVGDGPEKPELIERARREDLFNVIFVDPVPKSRVGDYINASDVCTAVLLDNPHYNTVYPNKMFDYMCCGRPMIMAIGGVARELVEQSRTGLFSPPENPQAFRQAIMRLREDAGLLRRLGENGPPFVRQNFCRETLAEDYLRIITGLAQRAEWIGA